MAPRIKTHYAKSQEVVYKKLGSADRPVYKEVRVRLQPQSSAQVIPSSSKQSAPPVVAPPPSDDVDFGINEDLLDFEHPQRKKKVHLYQNICIASIIALQKQSDYMRDWLKDKRAIYLEWILRMKAGADVQGAATDGNAGSSATAAPSKSCVWCGMGRAVWRCLDCLDKRAVCVLCCQNSHGMTVFHRIEKWNGRHYQQGALWQVGVKIHTGHNGSPCPRGQSGLAGLSHGVPGAQEVLGVQILEQVARDIGKPQADILAIVAEALDHPPSSMSQTECDVLNAIAQNSGQSVLDILIYLNRVLSSNAESESEDLQAHADRTAAQNKAPPSNPMPPDWAPLLFEEIAEGDDDEWEDEDERPAKGPQPRFLPRPPPTDGAGNKFITVVHTNGFHTLPIVWCTCPNNADDRDLQLLELHLYPASVDRINTAFTFKLLDDHRYDYLECKSSRYQFHNKLRRLTSPLHPDGVPSRYTELGRVSRQWRNLKYRKWFWQMDNSNGKRGSMALFCAACPQDGINLPADWQTTAAASP